jgi:hypothetical protein
MAFELSKKDRYGKTELLAQAREKYTVVCAQIEAINAMLDGVRDKLGLAFNDYAELLEKLQGFADKTVSAGNAAFEEKPLKWQRSEDGQDIREWLAWYQRFKVDTLTVPELPEIEAPDEAVLTLFEELPDTP